MLFFGFSPFIRWFMDLHSRTRVKLARQQKEKVPETRIRFGVAELLLAIVPLREGGRIRKHCQ